MYPETNTLPKQHTPSLQGGVVDYIIASDNNDALTKLVYDACNNHGIVCNHETLFEYMRTYEEKKGAQMELF
jgi:siroheme synthase (precorrin-2 oxidase/ferrochelatase)